LIAVYVLLHTINAPTIEARPVRLVISGPDGQRFAGSYIADGITHSLAAVAPATISLQARDVAFEFKREGGDEEFRVELFVGGLRRTSTTSDKRQGVRGELRYSARTESYWATAY
jgi:hypothetical protein